MENAIEIKNLNKKYPNFELSDINITVPKGSIVGFIGENGAGKTTTIKAILNMFQIDNGEIKVLDRDYKNETIKEDIGIVLDNIFMNESITPKEINKVMKNIYLNWNENTYNNYLQNFNLDINKKIKDFSTGMLMKLKIATALSHNPKLLILDEPTSGLDPIARNEIINIFEDFIKEDDHTIFVSSHITSDLEQIADYIIFIHKGKIILTASKKDIFDNYGIITLNEKDFLKIKKEDIIKYQKKNNNYEVLTNNKSSFKKKYKIKEIEKPTLDEIMLLYIKGEKYE